MEGLISQHADSVDVGRQHKQDPARSIDTTDEWATETLRAERCLMENDREIAPMTGNLGMQSILKPIQKP